MANLRSWIRFFFSFFSKKQNDSFDNTIRHLKAAGNKMQPDEKNIYNNLLKFSHQTVADIIIPRSDIVAINLNTTFTELAQVISLRVPHTRILVYQDSLDNIVGFVHIKDLLKMLVNKEDFDIKKILLTHIIAVPSMKLIDLLVKMKHDRVHIAIVIDEYGCTDGIVTIENLIEVVLGPIDDEHDDVCSHDIKVISNNAMLINARVKVEEIEAITGLQLKGANDEFETMAGLVLARIGYLPLVGTKIDIDTGLEIEVMHANPRTLTQLKIRLHKGRLLYNTSLDLNNNS
jgi:CBS domain containing-hemolysin-like protein